MSEKILDLGCGARKTPGATGLDQVQLDGVDIVHDLDSYPYPIQAASYDRVVLRHVAEHVDDVVALMEECHRIVRPGGVVEIHVPHYTSSNSYNDPTHKHHFSLLTWEFFCGGTAHGYLVKFPFRMKKRVVDLWALHDKLGFEPYRWIGIAWLAERHPIFYERFLAFLFPLKEYSVELEVLKPEGENGAHRR